MVAKLELPSQLLVHIPGLVHRKLCFDGNASHITQNGKRVLRCCCMEGTIAGHGRGQTANFPGPLTSKVQKQFETLHSFAASPAHEC
jgi:hypothetical protein